jgi:hypothetical protein
VSIGQLSFWQQNVNWRIEQQRWSDTLGTTSLASSVIAGALTDLSTGLAAISNQRALARVTQQLRAAEVTALGPARFSQLSATAASLTASKSSQSSSKSSSGQSLNLLA